MDGREIGPRIQVFRGTERYNVEVGMKNVDRHPGLAPNYVFCLCDRFLTLQSYCADDLFAEQYREEQLRRLKTSHSPRCCAEGTPVFFGNIALRAERNEMWFEPEPRSDPQSLPIYLARVFAYPKEKQEAAQIYEANPDVGHGDHVLGSLRDIIDLKDGDMGLC